MLHVPQAMNSQDFRVVKDEASIFPVEGESFQRNDNEDLKEDVVLEERRMGHLYLRVYHAQDVNCDAEERSHTGYLDLVEVLLKVVEEAYIRFD